MPKWTTIVTGERRLKLFKRHRSWQRDLQIQIKAPGQDAVLVVDFPANQDILGIDELELRDRFEVMVRRHRRLHRLKYRNQKHQVQLGARSPRLLITGSGRCGTRSLASYLDGLCFDDGTPAVARHEPLSEYVVPALLSGQFDLVRWIQRGLGHTIEAAPYYALFPEAIAARRVIHLIRDGRRVVQSGLLRGWYQNDSIWNQLKPSFEGDAFSQSCHLWRLACEQAEAIATDTFRLEDLCQSTSALASLNSRLGLVADGRTLPHLNPTTASISRLPWTQQQRTVFAEIAGPMMDAHYPGWCQDWP